jgi:hypothetical protein
LKIAAGRPAASFWWCTLPAARGELGQQISEIFRAGRGAPILRSRVTAQELIEQASNVEHGILRAGRRHPPKGKA